MKSEVYWSVEYHCLSTVLGVSAILHDTLEKTLSASTVVLPDTVEW